MTSESRECPDCIAKGINHDKKFKNLQLHRVKEHGARPRTKEERAAMHHEWYLQHKPTRPAVLEALESGKPLTAGEISKHTRMPLYAVISSCVELLDAGRVTVSSTSDTRHPKILWELITG